MLRNKSCPSSILASTKLMIADPMTKCLLTKPYKDHVEHMGLNSLFVV